MKGLKPEIFTFKDAFTAAPGYLIGSAHLTFFFFPRNFPVCKIAMEHHKNYFSTINPFWNCIVISIICMQGPEKGAVLYNLGLLYCVCFVCVSGS